VGAVDALGVCNGQCEVDADNDGVCDNVDPCVGAVDALGVCNGQCEVNADSDGVCDDEDLCTNMSACNYNRDNEACKTVDCAGECGGDAVTDDCGVCSNADTYQKPGQHRFCNPTSGLNEERKKCPEGEGVFTYENVAYNEDYSCVACSVNDRKYSDIEDHSRCQDHDQCQEGEGTTLSDEALNTCEACVDSFSSQPSYDSCTAWKTCGSGEYQTQTPTATQNRMCETWETCDSGEYETQPPSATQNRMCATKVCSNCVDGDGAMGEACGSNEGEDCASCDQDYSLFQKRCYADGADGDGDGVLNKKEISDKTDPTDENHFKPCSTTIAKHFIDAQCCQCS